MNRSANRMSSVMLPCVLTLLAGGACSSKDAAPAPPPGVASDLVMFFSPMYSAYDGGLHTFKIPVVVENVDPTAVEWSASDPSMVNIAYDATLQGAMIETRKAGTVTIIAKVGDQTGRAVLNISQASAADWEIGNMRYNNGMVLTGTLPTGMARPEGGLNVSCTNCHGDTANGATNQFRTVAHTPEQTGGFSDMDLINIFTKGMVPPNSYFDTSVVTYQQWQAFHVWQMTPEDAKGIIVYLRALTPQTQGGARGAFGGAGRNNRRDAGP
jgi:hypothetical protein